MDNILSYSVPISNANSKKGFYIATSHLKKPWRRNQATTILLKLHYFNGLSRSTSNIAEVKLEPARVLFPINLSLAFYRNKILVAWQETSLDKKPGSRIKFIYSGNGPKNFSKVRELNDSANQKTAILPIVLADQNGKFHIFYQKETNNAQFTMFHSSGNGGNFSHITEVVDDIEDIGRGAFFPSIVMYNNEVNIFYQNKPKQPLKDEIFHVQSSNNGRSFGSPNRLTNNVHSDFSPFALLIQNKIEFVWQARLNGVWTIFYSSGGNPRRLTQLNTDAYSPNMVYIKSLGRIVAWYDFREDPPQIYAFFLDKANIEEVGRPHNVSRAKGSAKKPRFVKWKKFAYLFYLVNHSLYFRKVDSDTGKIKVVSKTHSLGKPSRKTKGTFELKIPEDPSGVREIAWVQDRSPHSIPEIYNLSSLRRKVSLSGLEGGNYYLHVRYKDNVENESSVTHYNFIIDNEKPNEPIISSSTHKEKAQSTNRNVRFEFNSIDDSAIGHYEYAFSTNRVAKFKEKTKQENLSFNDVEPNTYFFKVRAIDLAGNYSTVNTYRIEIIHPEDRVSLYTNLESQQLRKNFFTLEYIYPDVGTKLKKVYYRIGSEKLNPYKKGGEIAPETTPEGQRILIPMLTYRKKRLYTISFGFDYFNGRRGKVRAYSFEYLGQEALSKPKPILQREPEGVKREQTLSRSKKNRRVLAKRLFPLEALISTKLLDEKNNLYEISFSINKVYEKSIKGYSWHLAGNPEIPELNRVNSKGGPEYVYQLEPGVYYLTVLPIFRDRRFQKKADYAYQRIFVREKYFLEGKILFFAFASVLGILFLAILTSQYRRIVFYVNAFLKS